MRFKVGTMALALIVAVSGLQAGPSKSSNVGIGLAVPFSLVPTVNAGLGLSGKVWMNAVNAVDIQLAGGSGWLSVSGDYLWHRYNVFSGSGAKRLPIYFGPGANLTMWSAGSYSGAAIGVQAKLGVDYLLAEPFDLYVEMVPGLLITPAVGFSIGTTFGGRWYF